MGMSIPQLDLLEATGSEVDDEIRAQVWGLLTTLYPRNDLMERRRDKRYPFPCLVHLTPVARDGVSPEGNPVVVIGRDISEHGMGFFHHEPLPYRRVIASVEPKRGQWIAFLVDLTWCRFTKGWYESGGRFIQSALSPME